MQAYGRIRAYSGIQACLRWCIQAYGREGSPDAPRHLAVEELGHDFLLVGDGPPEVARHLHDVQHALPVAHRQQLLVLGARPELQAADGRGADRRNHRRLV
eukprot:8279373-Pyramimonas_sp.AAC.1